MGAVAAVLHLRPDGSPPPSAAPMVASMAGRAPDGTRTWTGGPASLGHAALHATPEAVAEQLPLQAAEGTLAITATARIDNRGELLRELRIPDTDGDARLILAAYERWGENCPERLLGDFAFAIWDERNRRLFCVCDRFAVRPLYWHRSAEIAAVATEIKALLALDAVPRRLTRSGSSTSSPTSSRMSPRRHTRGSSGWRQDTRSPSTRMAPGCAATGRCIRSAPGAERPTPSTRRRSGRPSPRRCAAGCARPSPWQRS